jgi:hypothetical protein
MFQPPVRFDANEWVVLFTMVALPLVMYMMPKRLSVTTAITVMLYNVVLSLTTDMFAGSSFPWDFYDTMDTSHYELFDLFIYLIPYPVYGYFFAWGLSYWREKEHSPIGFVLLWATLTTLLEWISSKFHVYIYKEGWGIGDSAVFYLVYFSLEAWFVYYLFTHNHDASPEGTA